MVIASLRRRGTPSTVPRIQPELEAFAALAAAEERDVAQKAELIALQETLAERDAMHRTELDALRAMLAQSVDEREAPLKHRTTP